MNEWPADQDLAARPPGDDTQEVPTRPGPGEMAAGTTTFHRALIEVQIECDALVSALERREPIDVEIAACDLASTWLAAQAAISAIEPATADAREQSDIATLALCHSRSRLVQLFGSALAETSRWGAEAPRLHDLLRRLGASLRLPIAQGALDQRHAGPSSRPRHGAP